MNIAEETEKYRDEVIALRRDFHQNPELGFNEYRTAEVIEAYLQNLGLDTRRAGGAEKRNVSHARPQVTGLPIALFFPGIAHLLPFYRRSNEPGMVARPRAAQHSPSFSSGRPSSMLAEPRLGSPLLPRLCR